MAFQDTLPPQSDVSRRAGDPPVALGSWLTGLRAIAPVPASASAALAVLLYASSLDNPFVYDDFRLIVENPAIQNLSSVLTVLARDMTRPVVALSYVADTALWGTSPFGYHLTNVLLHAVNVVLAYWVAFLAADDWRRSGGGKYAFVPSPTIVATVTSLLTAAHPVMTQAVGYITARSELLYGAFFLSALLAARRWMLAGGVRRVILAVGLWACALLSKEAAGMLPIVLWCYDAWVIAGDREARWQRAKRLYLPLIGAVLLVGAARLGLLVSEYPDGIGPDWSHVFVAVDAFWQYLALFVRPHGQTIMHTVPLVSSVTPRVAADLAGLGLLAALIWRLRQIQGLISLGLMVAAALLVPGTVLFVAGVGEPMAEHRAYISAIGFFLACGAMGGMAWRRAVSRGRAGRVVVGVAAATIALQFLGLTVLRNEMWGSSVDLAKEAVRLSPGEYVPRLFLGETLRQTGRCDEAVPEYRAVIAHHVMETFTRRKLFGCLMATEHIEDARLVLQEMSAADRRALCGGVPGAECP
jgi:hypothetical protein